MGCYYRLRCPACGVADQNDYNRAGDSLAEAVLSYPAARAAADAGWDVTTFNGFMGVGPFLLEHAPHGPLEVIDEYGGPPVIVDPLTRTGPAAMARVRFDLNDSASQLYWCSAGDGAGGEYVPVEDAAKLGAVAAKVMEIEARCYRSGAPSLRDWADLAALAAWAISGPSGVEAGSPPAS